MSDRLIRTALAALALASAGFAASPARAALDPPSSGALFGFPGAFANPATPSSAAHALADRWLGDAPWDDPAAPAGDRFTLDGALFYEREDRQDLHAANREYDSGAGALDFGSVALGARLLGRWDGWVYAFRPETRYEDVAFLSGLGTDPSVPSAVVTGKTDSREVVSGGALSAGFGGLRIGVAVEVTDRSDDWTRTLDSGDPQSGTRHTDWHGSAVGGQLGFVWTHGDSGLHRLTLGGAVRRVPKLELSGSSTTDLLVGASDSSVTTTREAGWEGGVSAGYQVGEAVRLIAGGGFATAMDWSGLDATTGRRAEGGLAIDYHDSETPWTVRAGYSIAQQSAVDEGHAGTLGLGFGWDFGGTVVELGGIHRSIHRPDQPGQYQDRVLLGFHARF